MNQSQPHRATHEQWQKIEEFVKDCGYDSCLLELRARIEALELAHRIQSGTLTSAEQDEMSVVPVVDMEAAVHRAAAEARDAAMDELRAASAEARPGGLVERVEEVIINEDWMNNGLDESVCGDDDPTYRYTSAACNSGHSFHTLQARAAIREVAAWLRTGRLLHAAELLELEADR